MSDHEYIIGLKNLIIKLNRFNPIDQDEVADYVLVLKEIRDLNTWWREEHPEYD